MKHSELSGLKTLFGWAVSNRRLTANPAAGITIKLGKPQRLRGKGLTEDEARAILQGCFEDDGGGKDRRSPTLGSVAGGLTGARVGELAQLRKQDVRQEGEHWTIRLTPEAGTIKTNEARIDNGTPGRSLARLLPPAAGGPGYVRVSSTTAISTSAEFAMA